MPPCFPHAVFTPEDCLMVGGQFYTSANLGRTLEGLKAQEDNPEISNETIEDTTYRNLAYILRQGFDYFRLEEKARVLSNLSLFIDPDITMEGHELLNREKQLRKSELTEILKERNIQYSNRATKSELLELVSKSGGVPQDPTHSAVHRVFRSDQEEFLNVGKRLLRSFI